MPTKNLGSQLQMALLATLVLWCGNPAAAQIPQGVEGEFRPVVEGEKAIGSILSPFCPGLMLEQCPSAEAGALRDSIQGLAMEGWTSAEIVEWMLANHGEEYRAIPPRTGAALWAWVMPPLAILLGIGVVFAVLRHVRGPLAQRTQDGRDPSPEEEARLRAALRELDAEEEPA
ncbi:MAG: cytochrome c-type biogenesis protein CcmH [Gemmatimonadota bacterium]